MFQNTKIIPFPKIRSIDNQDVCLPPNYPSGTETDASQNILPLCEKQSCESDDKRPLAIQTSHSVLSVNLQEIDFLSNQQYGNKQIMSQRSFTVSYHPHQSTSHVSQAAGSVSRDGFVNEFSPTGVTNIGGQNQFCGGTSRVQGSSFQTFQQSEGTENNIQSSSPQVFQQSEGGRNDIHSSYPQECQQSEGGTNYIQMSHPRTLQQCDSDPNVIKISSTIGTLINETYSPMTLFSKESVVNDDLCSLTQQPVESRTQEIQGFPQVAQTFKLNSPTERHLPYSQHTSTEQQSKKSSSEVQQAKSVSSTISPLNPLLDNFLRMCCVMDQNGSPDEAEDRLFWPEHYDLSIIQCRYAKTSEHMNIIVYGPVNWTSELLLTFTRRLPLKFVSPFSLIFQGNVNRCGILTLVSVWQIDNLINSLQFLKLICACSKTTIIFVFNLKEQSLQFLMELTRREVDQNTPIMIVVNTKGRTRTTLYSLPKTGFKLKAKYDLSAFLMYHLDSLEEVDAVFFTAIDLSRLNTT